MNFIILFEPKNCLTFKSQSRKIIKHTQLICLQFVNELFECDHFVGLALKGLR